MVPNMMSARKHDPDHDKITPEEAPIPAEAVQLPARGFSINRAKALAAAGVLWVGWALMIWAVLNEKTGAFDRSGLLLYRTGVDFHPMGGTMLEEAVRDVTALGGVLLTTIATGAACVALLFLKLRREAMLFAITVILGWLLNDAMKIIIGRDRPELVPQLTQAAGYSFPSGHSFASAMVYIGMALAFASMSDRHSVRYTMVGAAMALSAMIAWSRVMLGVHYPSDALAGWMGGAAWAFTAATLLYKPARAAAESELGHKLDPIND